MAKRRRRTARRRARRPPSKSRTDWGHYLFQDSGVSVAYVGKVNEDGSVEAALFGVDTWRDGLIVCYGQRFEAKGAFEEAMQSCSNLIRKSTRFRCRSEIAYGLRVRLTAKVELPPEFDRWRHLVDPLEDVNLPSHLYRCPGCGGRLPELYIQQILEGIDGEVMFYFVCDRCKRPRSRPRSAEYAGFKHREVIQALEEVDGFSATWDQDNAPMFTQIPVGSQYSQAVRMTIAQGDNVQAACMAIECHIAYASVPNRTVEDRHVLAALHMVRDGRPLVEDGDADSETIGFLVSTINDGIGMFRKAMRLRGRAEPHVRLALQRIMDSVENHQSGDPRAYIQFINRFIRV
jgi:hypothetical protein